jgi:glycosyltransferase involved in cell wall biosynthesis
MFVSQPDAAMADSSPCLSILIPVYNEQATIRKVLDKVLAVAFPVAIEIVVVDDGSKDGSAEELRSLPPMANVRAYFHEVNAGKGAAIQTALREARGQIVVIQDADEELNPADLLPLLQRVHAGGAPVCYGSRFLGDVSHLRWLPTYWANRILNGICNVLNGLSLTDMNTCYKMMRADIAMRLGLESRGFAMEPEITTKLARMGIEIVELPISYQPRQKTDGKKIRFSDFFKYIQAMIRFRFFRRHAGHETPRARTLVA